MITRGSFIKHDRYLDVCIEVLRCYDYGQGLSIKGVWWNLGMNQSHRIGYPVNLDIAKTEHTTAENRTTTLAQWKILHKGEVPLEGTLRDANWVQI